MTKPGPKKDETAAQAAAQEARENGTSPSAAGVTTGASKQIDHHTHSERHDEPTPRGGKS
ncbi:hypothetical protein [Kineococcus rubinsiae]|uniref:hypothetical protein n=1 Tax=Kineococcus rubinsiae TaxID=2609562 RepID=UPI00143062F4|nr:hypothetical protein [Kineococcus rubinsiae]NIZ91870.1 hypothetical protein [Kineococcus rubinsiae]